MTEDRKRPAFEPPTQLILRTQSDPDMRRPASTVAGAVLVLLRAAAGALWVVSLFSMWNEYLFSIEWEGAPPDQAVTDIVRSLFAAGAVVVILAEVVLAVLILRGRNWPRVLVMSWSATFIGIAFVGWWFADEVISLETTLVSLALDVLILLALSSRGAAAYARRGERVGREAPGAG